MLEIHTSSVEDLTNLHALHGIVEHVIVKDEFEQRLCGFVQLTGFHNLGRSISLLQSCQFTPYLLQVSRK